MNTHPARPDDMPRDRRPALAAGAPAAGSPAAATPPGLRRALRLTRAGLWAESLARAFWPLWAWALALASLLGLGLQDLLPAAWALGLGLGMLGLGLWALAYGLRRFHRPGPGAARARLDATLPGRPLAALADSQALGGGDAGSAAVWAAHRARMAALAARARAPAPDLRLSSRDRFGLRYLALTAFVIALIFGQPQRMAEVAALGPGGPAASAAIGPSWEGWIEPPAYTGRPSLYVNGLESDRIELPQGSRLVFRLYGEPGAIRLNQTIADPVVAPAAASATEAENPRPEAPEFIAQRSGLVQIEGPGGRSFQVIVQPDAPPQIDFAGDIARAADGQLTQPFQVRDDFGVVAGRARVVLDLAAVDRRFGLALPPEDRPPYVLDLPLPITGSRAEFTEQLIDNASKHAFANLPVRLQLEIEDGIGQLGQSPERALILPGRRFFDPLAAAVIELRRDLLWNRANGARSAAVLRAITHRPEGFFRSQRAYLMTRVAIRRLEAGLAQGLTPAVRDDIAEALWDIAVLVEDGGLSDALARMQRAQERLSEAIRNGANSDEIAALMEELRQATQDYIRQLAERGQEAPQDQAQAGGGGQQISGDQLQQMMDEIQRLMEEGRMAEAQALLEQFNRMMENLQVTQGQGGQGDMPGGQAMRDLSDALRNQQGLSDETFRDLQQGPQGQQGQQGQGSQGQGPQGQGGQGQQGPGQGQQGQGEGQQGQGQQPGGQGQGQGQGQGEGQPGSLADRQQALRQELRRQEGNLPGAGSEAGRAARDSLGRAGRAMDQAEESLRQGDTAGALDRQAEAIENLRESLRSLGQAMAEQQSPGQPGGDQPGQEGQGQAAQNGQGSQRDPLGRMIGQGGRAGSDDNMLQGEDVYRRARDLLDEIRRRAAEQGRPEIELDYLRRLLDRF